jgi:hypothetical protein
VACQSFDFAPRIYLLQAVSIAPYHPARQHGDCACNPGHELTQSRGPIPEQAEGPARPEGLIERSAAATGGRRVIDLSAHFRGEGSMTADLDIVKPEA